jgi:hypothetical protein
MAGRMAGMMVQKRREEKCRSSKDVMGNRFPDRSVRRIK